MMVNLTGEAQLVRRLLASMGPGSQILLMSFISPRRGGHDPTYATSKVPILALVKSLATSLAPDVRANTIAPGFIQDFGMYPGFSPECLATDLAQIRMPGFLRAKDLAAVIEDLTGEHWFHMSGACIDLNGGQHVR